MGVRISLLHAVYRSIQAQTNGSHPLSTWMVVEDEPNIYDLLITMCQMWGIDGKAFNDGEPAQA